MPWFPVDDSFYSHPKVLATSLAARGLWATAGSWSSAHLQDGAVPDHVLGSLGGTPELAAELVAAGLWRRTRRGYVFHDWLDWGSKRTADEIRELRKVRAESGRKGGVASGKARSKKEPNPKQVASPLVDSGLNPSTSSYTYTALNGPSPPPGARDPNPNLPDVNGSPASRLPSARPLDEALRDAGVPPGHRPASEQAKAAAAKQARRGLRRPP
jgi:hypothetical protein